MSERHHISGTFFEGCRCQGHCPCDNSCPTARCNLAVGWHIDQGSLNAIDVSGLNVVGVFETPDNFANGAGARASLYLDQRANPDQQQALKEIFTGQLGGQMGRMRPFMGEFQQIKTAPIELSHAGGRSTLRVPGVIEGELEYAQTGQFLQ